MILERNDFTYFEQEDIGKDIEMFSSHAMTYVGYAIRCGHYCHWHYDFLPDGMRAEISSKADFNKLPNQITTHEELFNFINDIFGCKVVSNDFKKMAVKRWNPSKLTSIYVACDSDMSSLGGGRKFTFKEFDFIDQEVRCVESTSPYQYEFTKKAEKKFSQFLNEAIKYNYKVKFEMSDLKEIFPNMRKKDSWIIIPFSDHSTVTKAVSRGIYIHFVGTTLTSNQKKKAFCEEHGFSWIDDELSIMFDLVVVGDKYPDTIKSSTANGVWSWSKLMYYYKMLPQERRPIFVRESTFNEILEAMSE